MTLGGPVSTVTEDVQTVVARGAEMGLHLNCSKSELISHGDVVVQDATLSSFCRFDVTKATLLGAPLFPGESLDAAWQARCLDLERAVGRLRLVSAQDALLLLRASFSAPRVQYLMRCSPSVDHSALARFDQQLRSAVSGITNTSLTDTQWL